MVPTFDRRDRRPAVPPQRRGGYAQTFMGRVGGWQWDAATCLRPSRGQGSPAGHSRAVVASTWRCTLRVVTWSSDKLRIRYAQASPPQQQLHAATINSG